MIVEKKDVLMNNHSSLVNHLQAREVFFFLFLRHRFVIDEICIFSTIKTHRFSLILILLSLTINMPGKTETTVNGQKSAYVGALSDLSMEALLTLGPPNNCGNMPAIRLFLAKYQAFPCVLYCAGDDTSALLHATTVINYIRDELKHDLETDRISRNYHNRSKQIYVDSRFADLGDGIMIDFTDCYFNSDVQNPNKLKPDHSDDHFLIPSQVSIYYLPQHDAYVQELAARFSKMTVFSSKSCTLQMVCRNQHGYYLNGINIKKPLITDLALHYGKRFVPLHDKIIKNLNKKEGKGIVLLHGLPGSGKLQNKRRFFWINRFV